MSRELSNKIANMSFVCACLVVLIHAPGFKTGWLPNDFIYTWVKHGLTMIAVPVFFIISGFLLGRHINEIGWYCRAIKSRIRSLVIPFFALNLLWLPIFFLSHYIGVRYFGADDSNRAMDFTVMNILYWAGFLPWGGGCVGALWYIRALLYLVLLSPVLAHFLSKGGFAPYLMLALFLCAWCWQSRLHLDGTCLWEPMTFTFCFSCPLYFSIGMMLSKCDVLRLPTICYIVIASISICLFACCILCPASDQSVKTFMRFLTTISLALALWSVIPSCAWPHVLVRNSFRIFVLHGMVLFVLPFPFKACGLWTRILSWPVVVPIWVITIAVSIVAAELLRRYAPKTSALVFGGR